MITAIFNVLSQQLQGILTYSWRQPIVEDFTDMGQDTCWFFHQDLSKHHETKICKIFWKIISCIKILYFKEHSTKIEEISIIFICFFFCQTSLVFLCKPVFIGVIRILKSILKSILKFWWGPVFVLQSLRL